MQTGGVGRTIPLVELWNRIIRERFLRQIILDMGIRAALSLSLDLPDTVPADICIVPVGDSFAFTCLFPTNPANYGAVVSPARIPWVGPPPSVEGVIHS